METVGVTVIKTEEYKMLIEKSLKYDLLSKMALERTWLTDAEKLIYGVEEEEKEEETEE